MWYRLSRREDDYCIEYSTDGISFNQMGLCHMFKDDGKRILAFMLIHQKILHLKSFLVIYKW